MYFLKNVLNVIFTKINYILIYWIYDFAIIDSFNYMPRPKNNIYK